MTEVAELETKYYDLIGNPSSSADELWKVAKELAEKDPMKDHTGDAAISITQRDPQYNPHEILSTINKEVYKGYTDDDIPTEIYSYGAVAKAVGNLVEHNKDLSDTVVLQTLNKAAKAISQYPEKNDDLEYKAAMSFAVSDIMKSYGKCEYNNPEQAQQALENIGQLSKNYPNETIKSVHSILNNVTKESKDVAMSAFRALNHTVALSPEEASTMLSMYKQISLENPDLSDDSIRKMHGIFKDFSSDEKIQKECLSTLRTLNGFRSRFDTETQTKLDHFIKSEQNVIDVQTVHRSRGQETTWKSATVNDRDKELSAMENTYKKDKSTPWSVLDKYKEMEMGM